MNTHRYEIGMKTTSSVWNLYFPRYEHASVWNRYEDSFIPIKSVWSCLHTDSIGMLSVWGGTIHAKWYQYRIDVVWGSGSYQINPVFIPIKSVWHRYEISMKSVWNRYELTYRPAVCNRYGTGMRLVWNRYELPVCSRYDKVSLPRLLPPNYSTGSTSPMYPAKLSRVLEPVWTFPGCTK